VVRKLLIGLVSFAATAGFGLAQAEAAEYKGGIKGDPDASLSIVVKKIDGARYVTRVNFDDVALQCDGGDTKTGGSGTTGKDGEPGLKVKQLEFSGPWKYGKVSGKFKGGAKLTGTVSIKVDAGPPLGDCKSGNLDYVVKG
jgi:hypothetical protein